MEHNNGEVLFTTPADELKQEVQKTVDLLKKQAELKKAYEQQMWDTINGVKAYTMTNKSKGPTEKELELTREVTDLRNDISFLARLLTRTIRNVENLFEWDYEGAVVRRGYFSEKEKTDLVLIMNKHL